MEKKVKSKKQKMWTYHRSHNFTQGEEGTTNVHTQLYQTCGVYMAVYSKGSNMPTQLTATPEQMVKLEKYLKKQFEEGKIQNLEFHGEITVIKDSEGFYKEVVKE